MRHGGVLLEAIEPASLLKNELFDYRRKTFDSGRPEYDALLTMLDRHIVTLQEAQNDKALDSALGKQAGKKTAAPAA